MSNMGTLFLLCGKLGAGKTTLSMLLMSEPNTVRISEDEWLAAHYPEQISTFDDYLMYSKLIKPFIKSHVQDILKTKTDVVMDFPANTIKQRRWLLSICEEINTPHQLIYIDVSDETCLEQIAKRSEEHQERAQFDKPEVFYHVTKFFEEPFEEEGLNLSRRSKH